MKPEHYFLHLVCLITYIKRILNLSKFDTAHSNWITLIGLKIKLCCNVAETKITTYLTKNTICLCDEFNSHRYVIICNSIWPPLLTLIKRIMIFLIFSTLDINFNKKLLQLLSNIYSP